MAFLCFILKLLVRIIVSLVHTFKTEGPRVETFITLTFIRRHLFSAYYRYQTVVIFITLFMFMSQVLIQEDLFFIVTTFMFVFFLETRT